IPEGCRHSSDGRVEGAIRGGATEEVVGGSIGVAIHGGVELVDEGDVPVVEMARNARSVCTEPEGVCSSHSISFASTDHAYFQGTWAAGLAAGHGAGAGLRGRLCVYRWQGPKLPSFAFPRAHPGHRCSMSSVVCTHTRPNPRRTCAVRARRYLSPGGTADALGTAAPPSRETSASGRSKATDRKVQRGRRTDHQDSAQGVRPQRGR